AARAGGPALPQPVHRRGAGGERGRGDRGPAAGGGARVVPGGALGADRRRLTAGGVTMSRLLRALLRPVRAAKRAVQMRELLLRDDWVPPGHFYSPFPSLPD